VLRPGGVLVASTFLKVAAPLGAVFGDDVVRPLNQVHYLPVVVDHFADKELICRQCTPKSCTDYKPLQAYFGCCAVLCCAVLPVRWSVLRRRSISWGAGRIGGGRRKSCGSCRRWWASRTSGATAPGASSCSASRNQSTPHECLPWDFQCLWLRDSSA